MKNKKSKRKLYFIKINKLIQLNKQKYNNSLVNFLLPTVMFVGINFLLNLKIMNR